MSRQAPALFCRHPSASAAIPWVALGCFPTPVQPLPGLGSGARVFVKRDDLSSWRYGGNKVRALEFLLGHAVARGARTVVTAGATGSHHVCALALFAAELGLSVEAVLWPQPWTPRCAEALGLLAHVGARVRCVGHPAVALLWLLWRGAAGEVYVVPPGGLGARGALGFVEAGLELADQILSGEMPEPASIWLACGTGTSSAGLSVGLALAGVSARIRAVRVTPRLVCNRAVLGRLAAGTRRLLEDAGVREVRGSPGRRCVPIEVVHEYYAPGYGRPNAAAEQAMRRLQTHGVRLDMTYSGRGMAALLERAPKEGGVHLFWHTLSAAQPPSQSGDAPGSSSLAGSDDWV